MLTPRREQKGKESNLNMKNGELGQVGSKPKTCALLHLNRFLLEATNPDYFTNLKFRHSMPVPSFALLTRQLLVLHSALFSMYTILSCYKKANVHSGDLRKRSQSYVEARFNDLHTPETIITRRRRFGHEKRATLRKHSSRFYGINGWIGMSSSPAASIGGVPLQCGMGSFIPNLTEVVSTGVVESKACDQRMSK